MDFIFGAAELSVPLILPHSSLIAMLHLSFKPKSFEQKFEWGGDCESGFVFSVVIIKHQFYERYDASNITPKTVHEIRELMHT